MKYVYFVIPGDLATPTGGYGYDRRLMAELRSLGWQVRHVPLLGEYPFPDATAFETARAAFAALPDGAIVLIDGLAGGVLADILAEAAARTRLVALVHHPLGDESGLSAKVGAALHRSERDGLRHCSAIVCTSAATGRRLVAAFGIEPARITVAPPGTTPGPRAAGNGVPPRILSVGSLIPRKRHDVLIAALDRVRDLDWTARIVGSADLDPDCATRLAAQIARVGLEGRIGLTGAITDTRAAMAAADLFVLASEYEGYGMAFAEALNQGLPVIACRAGAIADLVPEAAGALVPPGDVEALAAALAGLLDNPARRRTCAEAAFAAGRLLPDWSDTAARVEQALLG